MDYIFQKKRNVVFNIALWFLYYIVLLFIFSQGKTPINIDYIYTFGFLVFAAIPMLFNIYFLVPRLLQKGKYVWFSVTFIVIIIVFWQCYTDLFERLLNATFKDYYFISYQTNLQAITKFVLLLIVSMLLKIFENWLYFNALQQKLLQAENQRIQIQLTHLRSQINPHFLFNSLNVIYALAIEKKEETPEAIVQLSDVLRYIIYDADADRIKLKEEIVLLKNYLAFQKFRTHGLEDITFDITIEDEDFEIYPMLLLPLVENAFKHGMEKKVAKPFIKISLAQEGTRCHFQIVNHNNNTQQKTKAVYSGVGLENIQHNLEIVYPKRHQFHIKETAETFTVSLQIHQKETKK
ncbi:sensor histidine kinase [Kordia sp.]|uniref:sensor histidine kinase n=1 Tax=Kordia sp. TaxID=1965332 RepID=UPI003B5BA198